MSRSSQHRWRHINPLQLSAPHNCSDGQPQPSKPAEVLHVESLVDSPVLGSCSSSWHRLEMLQKQHALSFLKWERSQCSNFSARLKSIVYNRPTQHKAWRLDTAAKQLFTTHPQIWQGKQEEGLAIQYLCQQEDTRPFYGLCFHVHMIMPCI